MSNCKQKVEILIRRRVLRRLIWVCTVCLCPTKRTPNLYVLKNKPFYTFEKFIDISNKSLFEHGLNSNLLY